MLLNTHSKAFSQQKLPLLGCTLSKGMKLDTCVDLKLTPENVHLKKSWPAKIKRGSILLNLNAVLSVRVCHFTKEDFKRDLLVCEYWSW